ncbi:MAG: NADP-dependent isocitrate dehydrogenase [Pseudomonadota bacterium]
MTKSSDLITVAYGDGIGPEIMEAVLYILSEAKAKLQIETIQLGEELYKKGFTSGISENAWECLERSKILLKAPITTPQGGGYKSLNVTIRNRLGLYANLRPCKSYFPYVPTKHPGIDLVIVRENEEDLYSGIEHRQTANVFQNLKLISTTGSQKIINFAFEYARVNNRKKVTCLSKDNIMKLSDGEFHKCFDDICAKYPNIDNDHMIIDIGTARLAARPTDFDVVVTLNLYGDIISDVVAEVAGSVGMAGSANIGSEYAMFEAIHGSAPDIAGKNIANPSGLLNGAIMMLVHLGQGEVAAKIENAWLKTLEDGLHTADIYDPKNSKQKLGTKEFAEAVVNNFGGKPKKLNKVSYHQAGEQQTYKLKAPEINQKVKKQLVGVDVFFDWHDGDIEILANQLSELAVGELKLQMMTVRGLMVWPGCSQLSKVKSDHWRARFVPDNKDKITSHAQIIYLLEQLNRAKLDFVQTQNLYTFDGKLGFSLGQGE